MKIINEANEALSNIINGEHPDVTQVNELIYCTASIMAGEQKQRDGNTKWKEPAWKIRLRNETEQYRKDLPITLWDQKGSVD